MAKMTGAEQAGGMVRRAGVVLLPVHVDVAHRQARLVAARRPRRQEGKKTYYFTLTAPSLVIVQTQWCVLVT